MQLIFIYGPAAAGKLTVARELAKITGYPLFHNHLVVNALTAVFPFGSDPFVQLRDEFWIRVFQEATLGSRNLLFTFTPEPSVPEDFVARTVRIFSDSGSAVHFVKLAISTGEQERRIESDDRRQNGKLCSLEMLRHIRATEAVREWDLPVDLETDTESISPGESARAIVRAFGLVVEDPHEPYLIP